MYEQVRHQLWSLWCVQVLLFGLDTGNMRQRNSWPSLLLVFKFGVFGTLVTLGVNCQSPVQHLQHV